MTITELNVPNGSRDFAFKSQEIEQDGRRNFVGFQKYDVTEKILQDDKKMKVIYLSTLLFDSLKFCRLLELSKLRSFA